MMVPSKTNWNVQSHAAIFHGGGVDETLHTTMLHILLRGGSMKSRFLPILLLMLMLGPCAAAQPYQIQGKVVDKQTGEPLIGATVRVNRMFEGGVMLAHVAMGTKTDIYGEFCILGVCFRYCELEAGYVGFRSHAQVIECGTSGMPELFFELEDMAFSRGPFEPSIPHESRERMEVNAPALTASPKASKAEILNYRLPCRVIDKRTSVPLIGARVCIDGLIERLDSLGISPAAKLDSLNTHHYFEQLNAMQQADGVVRITVVQEEEFVLVARYAGYKEARRIVRAGAARPSEITFEMESTPDTHDPCRAKR